MPHIPTYIYVLNSQNTNDTMVTAKWREHAAFIDEFYDN